MSLAADSFDLDVARRPAPVWGALVSAGLHAAFVGILLFGPVAPLLVPPPVRSIAVEIVTTAQFSALVAATRPQPAPQAVAVPDVQPDAASTPVPDAAPSESGPVRATEFYSGNLLAEAASATLRRGLAGMDPRERLVQVCDIEAMEQIRRARPEFDPDMVVAYAMEDTFIRDGALVAEGAAFRSRREWYGLGFTCKARADLTGIEAFEFSVGAFVPHEEWDAHYLTAEEFDD